MAFFFYIPVKCLSFVYFNIALHVSRLFGDVSFPRLSVQCVCRPYELNYSSAQSHDRVTHSTEFHIVYKYVYVCTMYTRARIYYILQDCIEA